VKHDGTLIASVLFDSSTRSAHEADISKDSLRDLIRVSKNDHNVTSRHS